MKRLILAALTTLSLLAPLGCGKVYNSSTYDAKTYGSADGSAQFLAAQAIIKSNCASCHTRPSHQAWAGYSENDYINQGLIKAGNLSGSTLYTKILGNRTSTPGNMPDGGTPLTSDQLTAIENWILNIP
jgi:mono/diheme cytochrome c family protein